MYKRRGNIIFAGHLSIVIGLAFLWGFGMKVWRWVSFRAQVEAFLIMVNLVSSLYLVGGIGILKKKRWSVILVRLLSLVWLIGILEAAIFTFLIPRNLWETTDWAFFAWPISAIADFGWPLYLFLPFILFPCLYLWFFSLKNIKNRFGIEVPRGKNLRLWVIAILLPFLLYFISLSNFSMLSFKGIFKQRVCSPMTWEEFKIYKYRKELEKEDMYTYIEVEKRHPRIQKDVARHLGIEKRLVDCVYVKGNWLYEQWKKEGKTEEEFLALDKEAFEKTVLKYGKPKYIGGTKCY